MYNPNNFGVLTGRVSTAPKIFPCATGSIMILTVASRRNYGERISDFISFRQYFPEDVTWYTDINVGDKVTVTYQMQSGTRDTEEGKQYFQNCVITHLEFVEPRSTRDARRKEKAKKKNHR